jgi:hypothetical protein
VNEIEAQILQKVAVGSRDAGDIEYALSLHPLSWPADPADSERLKPLTTGQIEAVLEHLLALGLVEHELRADVTLWSITPVGKDALYDWDPWRFRVDELIPGWRPKPEEEVWGYWDPDPEAVVAVGEFVGSARPDGSCQHDSFEIANRRCWGWVGHIAFLLDDSGIGAVTTDVELEVGDVLIRRSPPPGEPRPEPVYIA